MPADKLLAFVEKAGINYPVALADERIARDYELGGYIPETIVIDKKGVIRSRHVGMLGKAELLKLFNEIGKD